MSLQALKKSSSLDKLLGAAEIENAPQDKKSYTDERLWKPVVDKTGNGYAVIRFLPTVEGDDLPWAKYWDHFFQGPTGQWYVEKSLTTIQKDDPVSEMNSKLWNTGIEADKDTARKRKRRLHYVSNIYVVSDPENRENEGKVMLYTYGAKIFEKIMDSMQPKYEDESPVNPFDMWKGANFKMKISNVAGYRNYDRSSFGAVEVLNADDSVLEGVYNQQFSLKEFTDADTFKSYSELNLKLTRVLGEELVQRNEVDSVNEPEVEQETRSEEAFTAPAAKVESDTEDTMSYFAKLAAEA